MAQERTSSGGPERRHRRRPGRPGRRRLTALATAAGALVAAGAAATAPGHPGEEPRPEAVTQIEGEIETMRAGGLPADHPKVDMLEAEIDALVEGGEAEPAPDPGMDPPPGDAGAATPDEAARAADDFGPVPTEVGAVECEPLPQMLTVDEVADASCLSVPQPDGSTRYVAVRPAGEVHVIGFGPGGQVERLPDRELPADPGGAIELVPDDAGDVRVLSGDAEVATLDLD